MGTRTRRMGLAALIILGLGTFAAYTYVRSATQPPPIIAVDGGAGPPTGPGTVEAMYIANEGVLITAGDTRVIIDGLFREDRGYPFLPEPHRGTLETAQPPFDRIDVILVSHRHLDHFHPDAVGRYLAHNRQSVLISSEQVVGEVTSGSTRDASIGPRVRELTPQLAERLVANDAGMELVVLGVGHGSGRHAEVQNLGHLVTLGGKKFLHLGDPSAEDRAIFEKLRLHEDGIDVAFLPMWFLTEPEGQEIVRHLIKPKHIVGVHLPPAASTTYVDRIRRAFPEADAFTTLLERRSY